MNLLMLLLVLAGVGVLLYLIKIAPFIEEWWKSVLRWVVIAIVVIWMLKILGVWAALERITL
jgi:hypothetical protein